MPDPSQASPDPIAVAFLEVRENIDALRALYPGRDDKLLALAALRKSATLPRGSRESDLLGLVGTVLAFAEKHAQRFGEPYSATGEPS